MKLKTLIEGMENGADGTATILLLFDKLSKTPQFTAALNQIKMPSDKYNAILKFASMMGIPEQKFEAFMTNMKQIQNSKKQPNTVDNEQ